ncbi:MAG: hypothetical protein OXF27_12870 [Acidobacteria bacterium]|nr:hypothetical protein [Acidobacteriota bacterium]
MSDITSADVMSILLPIWSTKPVTAKKVRGRIGAVMKSSIANGFRMDRRMNGRRFCEIRRPAKQVSALLLTNLAKPCQWR